MKRRDLIAYIKKQGCTFLREGRKSVKYLIIFRQEVALDDRAKLFITQFLLDTAPFL